jgi:hypothetical protein
VSRNFPSLYHVNARFSILYTVSRWASPRTFLYFWRTTISSSSTSWNLPNLWYVHARFAMVYGLHQGDLPASWAPQLQLLLLAWISLAGYKFLSAIKFVGMEWVLWEHRKINHRQIKLYNIFCILDQQGGYMKFTEWRALDERA